MTADFKRLGKRGAYGLGQLRTQGVPGQQPPAFRPRFVRPYHRWPVSAWLCGLVAGVLLIAAATAIGWWFMPFVIGLLAGLANYVGRWPTRVALPAVAIISAAGWVAPLWWSVLRGAPYGAVARVIAALLGLPGYAVVGIVLTVLIAVVQGMSGYWLGRAVTPLPIDDEALAAAPVAPRGRSRGRHAAPRGL
jgi:Na+-transporting methylmalonyl-CoA/oxaloacetate decarboxylase gamma subunit